MLFERSGKLCVGFVIESEGVAEALVVPEGVQLVDTKSI